MFCCSFFETSVPFTPGMRVVVVVVALTRVIQSVVTGQAPAALEWKNAPGDQTQTDQKYSVILLTLAELHRYQAQYSNLKNLFGTATKRLSGSAWNCRLESQLPRKGRTGVYPKC